MFLKLLIFLQFVALPFGAFGFLTAGGEISCRKEPEQYI